MPKDRSVETVEEECVAEGADAPTHRAPAVARAATILRLLANTRTGLGVSEIARRVGLVTSTCLHVLRALVEEGLVSFDDEKKTYRTAPGLLMLVRTAIANGSFTRAVQPALERLANEYPVTAMALEVDRQERMIVVAIARSDSAISLHVDIGSRFSGLVSATGRCFAAQLNLDKETLRARFNALRWEKPPRFEDWYADVERARLDKTATDHGNFVRGLTVVATALPLSSDGILRGISAVGFEHQLTERSLRSLRTALIEAANDVARLID
jgi:DNA-binding IclR family transcriptional regulator